MIMTAQKDMPMNNGTDGKEKSKRAAEAQERKKAEEKKRLAGALRANLMRRKAQSRARREGDADERDEGLPAAGPAAEE
jgi:hypothetical protein